MVYVASWVCNTQTDQLIAPKNVYKRQPNLAVFTRDNNANLLCHSMPPFLNNLTLPWVWNCQIGLHITPKKFYNIWLHSVKHRADNAACVRAWVCLYETTSLDYYAMYIIIMPLILLLLKLILLFYYLLPLLWLLCHNKF